MKLQLTLIGIAMLSMHARSQNVGVNTSTPISTLQVTGKPSTTTTADGVTIPSLTGNQLKDKDATYTASHMGTMVYVTSAVTGATTKTSNVTEAGFYLFDGSVWHRASTATQRTGQVLNTIVMDDPTLSTTTTPNNTNWVNAVVYNYTPVSSNSKIMVTYHNSNYTISGVPGLTVGDEFQSQILFGAASITTNVQQCQVGGNTGTSSRTGNLFPIAGVVANGSTSTVVITIQVRRSIGDDYLTFNGTNGTMIIQEIAN